MAAYWKVSVQDVQMARFELGAGRLEMDSGDMEITTLDLTSDSEISITDGEVVIDKIESSDGNGQFALGGGVAKISESEVDIVNTAGTVAPGSSPGVTHITNNSDYIQGIK